MRHGCRWGSAKAGSEASFSGYRLAKPFRHTSVSDPERALLSLGLLESSIQAMKCPNQKQKTEPIQPLSRPESFQVHLAKAFAFRDPQTRGQRRFHQFHLCSSARFLPQPTFYQAVERVHKHVDDAHIDRAIICQSNRSVVQARRREKRLLAHSNSPGMNKHSKNELMALFSCGGT